MTDQEINTAIAESVGEYRRVMSDAEYSKAYREWAIETDDPHSELTHPSKYEGRIRDFCNDLNAIREAVQCFIVGNEQLEKSFLAYLKDIVDRQENDDTICIFEYDIALTQTTARQRAEAFLRTLGKWKE